MVQRSTSASGQGSTQPEARSKLRLILKLPASHVGICIYHFITPAHFHSTTWLLPLIFTGATCTENLCLMYRSTLLIFQNVYLWTFSSRPSPSLFTPTSYKSCSRTTTAKIQQSLRIWDGDLLIKRQLHHSSSYLNYFFILSWHGWLSYMHTSKLQHDYYPIRKKTHWTFLCNSLKKLKTSRNQRLRFQNPGHKLRDPGHSSNRLFLDSLWPYTSHPLYRILPEVTGGFPKIQQRYHYGHQQYLKMAL